MKPIAILVSAFLAALLAAPSLAATRPALPDTGLYAPVAAQQKRRLAEIARRGTRPPEPRDVGLLLAAGRIDAAAALLDSLRGQSSERDLVSARVHLARLDFAVANPLLVRLASREALSDPERQLRFQWLFLRDDAAEVDRLTRGVSLAPGAAARLPDLLAAGRLAYDLLDYARADSCYARVEERTRAAPAGSFERGARVEALTGRGKVAYRRRDYDGALVKHVQAIALEATPDALRWLGETLIRLGRTDEAISAAEWVVSLHPYHESGHYSLGNGYARKNYTQLRESWPDRFADAAGRRALGEADSLLAAGRRGDARAAYQSLRRAHPGWADVCVRLASIDFEDGRFAEARDLCFTALTLCPEYGRAHATLAKALESQRFTVDVHRTDYERRFAAAPTPEVPGIERFVVNWRSLSPRHQKRVALSIAPWQRFIPVLVAGGATYYIKPLHMLLSETPGQETLRDLRIEYDSRLWDDVRGVGGYHTVTGVEDVERTIFDRYNTVLHELTHQVHAVLTADQSRAIQALYVRAKARDDSTKNGYLSRYAGGSVYEYFAEGANAWVSPRRDAYDPREEVRERLESMDPDLRAEVVRLLALRDVSASYPVAYSNAGDDELDRGRVDPAVRWYDKALERNPTEETALRSRVRAFVLGNRRREAVAAADRALRVHASSGQVLAIAASASWHGGQGLDAAVRRLESGRARVRGEDRHEIDLALGNLRWIRGDAAGSLAAYDSVIAYQSDHPEGLWGRASALALARRWDDAFALYDRAVRVRTGVVELRCDYARDLLRAGRTEQAQAQLAEARLLDAENPTAEALRGWAARAAGDTVAARRHVLQALEWGPWSDLARILLGGLERAAGHEAAAREALAPVRARIAKNAPPEYVYRKELAKWEAVHELPAVERELLAGEDRTSANER